MARALTWLSLLGAAWAQQAGTQQEEVHPAVSVTKCEPECAEESLMLTLDSQRRWLHNAELTNCFEGEDWDGHICPDGQTCATSCELEGIDVDAYSTTYGVTAAESEVEIKFIVETEFGQNVGSRLYLMEGEDTYKMFSLKNREIAFEVDVNSLPCGLNAALYLVEMPADGGKSSGNTAGAKFGTGYCDAQCPHDVKFMEGKSNTLEWNTSAALGKYGLCCAEVDIWEANSMATAFTMHPCTIDGTYLCKGKECGDNAKNERYDGVCDKDGCDFNSYRMGQQQFFGPGDDFTVDTTQPMTVVTQFVTDDGTDDGDLVEIRRLYVQGGKVIKNSNADILGPDGGDSITEAFCTAQKKKFNDPDDFAKKKGLKQTGEALRRGMTLVLSLWDDFQCRMLWLDSDMGKGDHSTPGVARGPCKTTSGLPADVRAKYPDAYTTYSNIMYGEIGSTYTASEDEKPDKTVATGFPVAASGVTAVSGGAVQQQQQQVMQQPQQQVMQQPQQQQATQQQVPSAGASSGSCSGVFQQCGGTTWTGATCCQTGCTCTQQGGPSYSQCLPPTGAYLCSGPVQQGLIQRNSLREASAPRADGSETQWASATVLRAALPALLMAVAAAAVWMRARRIRSSAQLRSDELNLMASAE